MHIILRIILISRIRVKRNSIEHSKVCYKINVARLKLNFVYPKGYLRWQGLICSRNTPNYHPPFSHIGRPFAFISNHMLCILRWYHWHSTSSPVASLPARSGFVDQAHYHRNMNLRVLDVLMPICYTIYGRHTHSHTHTHTPHTLSWILLANASFGIRWLGRKVLGMGTVHFFWGGKGERRVWSGDSFVEWHNKSTEIQIVAQSHTPTTEFYRHYEIPDNDTKAAAETTEKGPHK